MSLLCGYDVIMMSLLCGKCVIVTSFLCGYDVVAMPPLQYEHDVVGVELLCGVWCVDVMDCDDICIALCV